MGFLAVLSKLAIHLPQVVNRIVHTGWGEGFVAIRAIPDDRFVALVATSSHL
jgi:hypothetical protein